LVETQVNDKERHYNVQASVSTTRGDFAEKDLAQYARAGWRNPMARPSSGSWRLDAELSDKEIDTFIPAASADHFTASAMASESGVAFALRDALKKSKSQEEAMAAIARFVAEGGYEGKSLNVLRDNIGKNMPGKDGKPWELSMDVKLAGDKNF